MKKVWKKNIQKLDGGSSSSTLMVLDCDTWHNTNMPCGIFEFWSQ
jgi:hypothetical protein